MLTTKSKHESEGNAIVKELTEFQQNVLEEYRETRTCKIKVTFTSRPKAKQMARKMSLKSDSGRVRAYSCRYCSNYHIGHNKFANSLV